MMRRSRITVRPNVRPGGRGQAILKDGQSVQGSTNSSQESADPMENSPKGPVEPASQSTEVPKCGEDRSAEAENDIGVNPNKALSSELERASRIMDGLDRSGEAGGSSNLATLSWQRRKRFSAMPNLAKTRVTPTLTCPSTRGPRSSSGKSGTVTTTETTVVNAGDQPQIKGSPLKGFRSPSRQRTCSEGSQAKIQSEPLSPTIQDPEASLQGKKSKARSISLRCSQASDVQKLPNKVVSSGGQPGSLELRVASPEQAQGSVSSVKSVPPVPALSMRIQSVPSDRERILKAQKLRELLKQERKKERKHRKRQSHIFEYGHLQDHSKMTMGDLIYYLPETNPMKSYLMEESKQIEKESSPAQTDRVAEKPQDADEEEDLQHGDDEEPIQDEQLVVPRVKVAEDGTLIIDEESLTVEVSRVKGPNIVEEKDPIFERGSSTTYSSFRKTSYTKPWSNKETDMFFLAISMVGTDFSLIGQLFPHRGRSEIKNKFKKEERTNSWRIDKAFREKCRFDLTSFSSLLETILAEEQKKQEKLKNKASRKATSKEKGQTKARTKDSKKPTADSEVDSVAVEGETETAEKENEDCSNVYTQEETPVSQRRARRRKGDTERLTDGGRERDSSRKDDATACDSSGVITEGSAHRDVQSLERPDGPGEGRRRPVIKPAQISRGRLQNPIPNLGRQGSKKISELKRKASDEGATACEEDKKDVGPETESEISGARKPKRGKRLARALSSEDEERASEDEDQADLTVVQEQMLNRPTRSGRIPKMSQALQLAEEEESSEEPPPAPERQGKASPQHQRRQRPGSGQRKPKANVRSGRSKLVTLRASPPEDPKEAEPSEAPPEEPYGYHVDPEEQNQAPAFVPLSLRSPEPVRLEVEETMEELEILDPGALGTTRAEDEFQGPPVEVLVPATDQLDVLAAVMECLSPRRVDEDRPPLGSMGKEAKVRPQTASEQDSKPQCSTEPAGLVQLGTVVKPHSLPVCLPEISHSTSSPEEPHREKTLHNRVGCTDGTDVGLTSTDTAPPATIRCFQKPEANLALPSKSPVPASSEKREDTESESYDSESVLNKRKNKGLGTGNPGKVEKSDISFGTPQDGAVTSDPIVQTAPHTRRSRFPKPKPNLGRAVRSLRPAATLSKVDNDRPTKEIPSEDRMDVESSTRPISDAEAEPHEGARSPVVLEATASSAIEGREFPDTPVEPKAAREQALSFHTGEDNLAFVSVGDPTEGVPGEASFSHNEPTIILTLFEIPPTPVDEYQSSPAQVGAVTAELLSPLVFIDAQSEPQSGEPETVADTAVPGPCGSLPHFVARDSLVPVLEEPEGLVCSSSKVVERSSSTALTASKAENVNQSLDQEESVSLSLVPVEESSEVTRGGTTEEDAPPQKRWKMTVKLKKGRLRVNADPLKRASAETPKDVREDPSKGCQLLAQEVCSEVCRPGAQDSLPEKLGEARRDPPQQHSEDGRGFSAMKDPQPCITPVALERPLVRPGRKPKGFLSFMSNKTTAGPAVTPRSRRPAPQITTSCSERRRAPSSSSTGERGPAFSTTDASPHGSTVKMEPPHVSNSPEEDLFCVRPPSKTECEGPTNVSEYFFGDIFTEVEEPD